MVLKETVDQAARWISDSSENKLAALQISEWIHGVVRKSVDSWVEILRDVSIRAIGTLQRVAKEIGEAEAPRQDEFEFLLREMPRFELATLPQSVSVRHWKFWDNLLCVPKLRRACKKTSVLC